MYLKVEDEVKRTKLQLGNMIKQMKANGYFKNDDIVLQNVQKYVSSQKLRTQIKNQKTLKILQSKVFPEHYTELTYEKKYHPTDLIGLHSRTYSSSYFQSLSESQFESNIQELAVELDQAKNKKLKQCLKESLSEDEHKLLFLYDSKVPQQIPNSCNSKSIEERIQNKFQRLIGVASYSILHNGKLGSFDVKSIFPKNRQKRNIRKIMLALQIQLQNLRSLFIFVKAKKNEEDLFEKLGFVSTKASKSIQKMYDIKDEEKLATLTYISSKVNRDLKEVTYQKFTKTLTKRAIKLLSVIDDYNKNYVKPVLERKRVFKKLSIDFAILSDQAETPDIIFAKIRKFLLITKQMLLDVFVYQPGWNTKDFWDGFKKDWPLDHIVFVNPPFSQGLAAIEKCMDFYAKGGQVILLIPTISIKSLPLYLDYISKCTVRDDLPLFSFKNYNDPLFTHIVLLYFIQPSFLIELNEKKKFRSMNQITVRENGKYQRLWCLKREAKRPGNKAKLYSEADIEEMIELFHQKKSFYYITKYRKVNFLILLRILYSRLGREVVDKQLQEQKNSPQSQILS